MMFKKLQSLFGKSDPHPAMDWPQVEIQTPAFHASTRAIADLTFGSGIDGAMVFGAPEEVEVFDGAAVNLIYAKAGFQLGYEQDILTAVAYFVSQDDYQPDTPTLNYCEPVIDFQKLDSSHNSARIQGLFGSPKEVDEDEDETVLFYERQGLALEFEFTPSGLLKRVNIYPS